MQSNRTPDRVHVVHRPDNDDARNSPSSEIVRTLAQINDKLKRSEAERYELLAELREYRKLLNALEDKSEMTEKAYLSLEHKIQTRDKLETELTQRQARFEKSLKQTEEKLIKTVANQAVIDQKMQDNEQRHTTMLVRIDEAVSEQARMNLQIEKVADDKSRMLRKVDRLEEVIQETQDALKARAMVLLTDQSVAAQSGLRQIPAWSDARVVNDDDAAQAGQPWWRKSVKMQSVGMGAMVAAALLLGWTINQAQQPDIPQIAVLEGGGMARLNFAEGRWEPIDTQASDPSAAALSAATQPQPQLPAAAALPDDAALTDEIQQVSNMGSLLDADDQTLIDAMEADPDALAAQLNALEPGAAQADIPPAIPAPAVEAAEAPEADEAALSPIMPDFNEMAFTQQGDVANAIAAERDSRPLAERQSADAALPGPVKAIETRAFAGDATAQHDLAAIYTAGHAGVPQNFDRAAFWFREAAERNVGNARYNLGVLYHQGLGVERDLGRALYWYREAAKLNHPEAQYNLGIAHIEGIGTDYDPLLAAAYFERAANEGIMEAAYNLGLIYENGLLGEADQNESLLWYKVASDLGSTDARQALRSLASSMRLSEAEVEQMVGRMQDARTVTAGRRAGPIPASTN